jgi:hypothetical protein
MRRQHLLLDAGGIHQLEPPADVFLRIRDRVTSDTGPHREPDARENRSPIKSLKFFGI